MSNRFKTHPIKIRVWMLEHGVLGRTIADELGCTPAHVSMVIHGRRKGRTVAEAFIRRGCPAEYFGEFRVDRRKKGRKKGASK